MIKVEGKATILRREEMAGSEEHNPELFTERRVAIQDEQIGLITDTQITTGDFLMAHCDFQLTQPIQLIKEVETDIIQLDFALQGDSQVHMGGRPTQHSFSSGQHNISYMPKSKSTYAYPASEQDYSVIIIPREVYFHLLPPGCELHRQFAARVRQHKAGFITPKNLPITPAMAWLLQDMRTTQRTGCLKRLFLESRIIELLMLQLEQIQGNQLINQPLKKANSVKITEARELLDARYTDPPTIVELAKLIGLNEFNLKRNFKEQVGTTILGYITKKRMEEAKRWLLEGDKSISEISYWVGYKNPAHFTVAFKQFYGLLPSAMRTIPGLSQQI
ncbi:helix-turn-helix transcriptional regulator [Spirosoma sp. BT704]|uniref:Helix-turn-helix transcriptional regulator n=2 Tax=Spirosoma validum TaxID=2771355 RepID=A0A927B0H3_9BACT|nr:helix-turn-helix transcriptional regulator [Spirosoma validum]